MARKNKLSGIMRRLAIICDKSRPKGARGRAAIKRDRRHALQKGLKPSDCIFQP